ncbi:hypothetical protein J7438_14485 [Thalassotalea sp. G20_0]|uniref:hypothetical protein n=1 Tax=Thalassotalea sp. G20_0 TaxID=2821093 RepID=UPI001ADCCFEF|nr:hypothetical protein [Thalassotalea sp. G20_0]MBO9495285.1 hypothetical protein [Thalassotalea sp. G20_0]
MLITPLSHPTLPLDSGAGRSLATSTGDVEASSSDFMGVLLGEVTRHLQKTSGVFSGKEHNGTASLFQNELAGALLAQCLADRLTEKLSGDQP